MRTLEFLEDNDVVFPTDWCRPLQSFYDGSDWSILATKSPYTGAPMNNKGWIKVDELFGSVWFYKTKGDILSGLKGFKYEFVRGEIPTDHILEYDRSTNALLNHNKVDAVRREQKRLRKIHRVAPVIE